MKLKKKFEKLKDVGTFNNEELKYLDFLITALWINYNHLSNWSSFRSISLIFVNAAKLNIFFNFSVILRYTS